MQKINLTKEECYCRIPDLYDIIAKKLGHDPNTVRCDCRKIRVTKSVMDQIFTYYEKERYLNKEEISYGWVNYGPKANLSGKDYTAVVQKGFILEVAP